MKNLTYLPVAWACAGLCAALCLTLTLFPVLIFWLFDLVASPAATVLAKRAGVLFFGLSLIEVPLVS